MTLLKGESKLSNFLGLLLILCRKIIKSSLEYLSKYCFLGIYCLTKPLVYSFKPLSHEEYG